MVNFDELALALMLRTFTLSLFERYVVSIHEVDNFDLPPEQASASRL